ncbi:translocator protein-like [Ruditapes philippinarum]|uniref:translocator protein-like n=1 Tax=Ruditapes philippinarum TaxID=129788 RepID=UPI00295B8E04|nr:translocator protein-like [Ruditapes philippinarum]
MAEYLKPACAIFLPHIGGYMGTYFTGKQLQDWKKELKKPSFAPPDWLKSAARLTTYSCMGYGSYLVWREFGGFNGDNKLPLMCYGANLALSWSVMPLVSKTKNLGVGTLILASVVGTTIATAVTFKSVNTTAAYLVYPYLGWMIYSTIICFSMWRNNKKSMS